jgi:hypothetical protein
MKYTLLLALLVTMVAFSCQKGSNNSGGAISQRNSRVQVNSNNLPSPYQNETSQGSFRYTQSTGRIFTEARFANEFNGAIAALVSATLQPEDLGYVNPLSGVKLKGYVELDHQGRMLPSNSQIKIEIHDEFTGQSQNGVTIPPIIISVPGASGFASGGQAQLRFEDQLGWIQLNGTYGDGGRFFGVLSFQNSNGRSGENLSFEIETCGFFRCQ